MDTIVTLLENQDKCYISMVIGSVVTRIVIETAGTILVH